MRFARNSNSLGRGADGQQQPVRMRQCGSLLRLFAIGEGEVDVGERSTSWGELEEELDALLLDDGDVEHDRRVFGHERVGLGRTGASQLRGGHGQVTGEERLTACVSLSAARRSE